MIRLFIAPEQHISKQTSGVITAGLSSSFQNNVDQTKSAPARRPCGGRRCAFVRIPLLFSFNMLRKILRKILRKTLRKIPQKMLL